MSPASPHRRRTHRESFRRFGAPLAVFAGGAIGSAGRAAIVTVFPTTPDRFPIPTLLINLSGALLLGIYVARRQRAIVALWSLHFWAIGALGAFTTFSTFTTETADLISAGASHVAVWYVAASALGGITAALVGVRLGRVRR